MGDAKDLSGAVVVITGASSGLGRATALGFAAHGSKLVLAARGMDGLLTVADQCRQRGAVVEVVPTDIAEPEAVEQLASRSLARFGRIDVWIEAAGVLVVGTLGSEPVEEARRLVAVNVVGTLLAARAAMGVFEAQQSGTLILVSSMLGVVPSPLVPVYAMSKFAIRGLALSLRQSVSRGSEIHVCVVLPGPMDTPLFQHAANHTGRELRAIPPAASPARVAAAVVRCARRPRRQVTAGAIPRLVLIAHHVLPRATEWGVAQWSAHLVNRPAPSAATSGALFAPEGDAAMSGDWRRGRLRRRVGDLLGAALSSRRSRRRPRLEMRAATTSRPNASVASGAFSSNRPPEGACGRASLRGAQP